MQQPPRTMTDTFLNLRELTISIIQGLVITAAVLFIYQWSVQNGSSEEKTRAMVFTTLIFANVFLCLVNRSFFYSMVSSIKNRNRLFPIVIGLTLALLFAILYIDAFAGFFKVTGLSFQEVGITILVAGASVLWFEFYKLYKRITASSLLTITP